MSFSDSLQPLTLLVAQDMRALQVEIESVSLQNSLGRGGREYTSVAFSELRFKLQLPGPSLYGPLLGRIGNLRPGFSLVW